MLEAGSGRKHQIAAQLPPGTEEGLARHSLQQECAEQEKGDGGQAPGQSHGQCLLRDAMRKLPESSRAVCQEELARYPKVVNQERQATNRIYSLHEPEATASVKAKSPKSMNLEPRPPL